MTVLIAQARPGRRRLPAFRHLATLLGAVIVGTAVLVAIFAPYLTPHDPFAQNLNLRLIPPVWMDGSQPEHLLGTDQIGRDYLSRLIYGARISMLIGVLTVITSGLIGITLGIIGGFYGGRTDDVVMFLITCRLSIPLILVALTVVALVGSSLAVVILTLGLLLWDRFAVVARTTAMQVRNLDYIAAAQAAGASRLHILLREVLPNIANHLVVVAYDGSTGQAFTADRTLSSSGSGATICTAPGTDRTIDICFPNENSNIGAKFQLQAHARWDKNVITHMRVYIDNQPVYDEDSPQDGFIGPVLTVSAGKHQIVVVAWNSSKKCVVFNPDFKIQRTSQFMQKCEVALIGLRENLERRTGNAGVHAQILVGTNALQDI